MSPPPAKSSDELYQRGLAYYRAGNYQRCQECADQALAADSRSVPYLVLKGMALLELDQPEEAIDPLQQAAQLSPEDPETWRHLAVALMTAGELKAAAEAFRTALRLRPGEVAVMVDLANVLFMLGHADEAIGTLEESRRLRQGDLAILRNLADMYLSASRPAQALQVTSEVLELRPDDVVATCDAAWLYLQLERLDEAADFFRKLRRMDPEQEHELYAVHGLVMTEVRRRNWRQALELAIEATRLDRYELTTLLLAYINGKLFGKKEGDVTAQELGARFEAEHREHRRLHAEGPG